MLRENCKTFFLEESGIIILFFKRNLNIISNFKKLNEMCNESVLEKKLERKLGIEYR